MSRVGKAPIPLPKGVKVALSGDVLTVEGPKGKLTDSVHPDIVLDIGPEVIVVKKKDEENLEKKAIHGLSRALIANMVRGVTEGFSKTLEIVGVGYRAELKGEDLSLNIGYSHPVVILPPKGISFKVGSPTRIVVEGSDRQQVGQIAAEIRAVRKPEPYKGKGIRYAGEIVHRKAGKAGI